MLEMGVAIDFGQLVMDNEFARMIKHVVGGIPVEDETLAVDVIHDIGPFKDFLGHRHTLKHMRGQSQPGLIDRRTRSKWEAAGGSDMYQRALEKARQILESHTPAQLPESVIAELRAIVEAAEEERGVSQRPGPGDDHRR